jgi:hypothetical protein
MVYGQITPVEHAREMKTEWLTQLLDFALQFGPDFRQKISRALEKAKKGFQDLHLGLHKKARLDFNGDDKKRKLMGDPRLERPAGVALGESPARSATICPV